MALVSKLRESIYVRLTGATKKALEGIASENQVGVSDVARAIIVNHLDAKKRPALNIVKHAATPIYCPDCEVLFGSKTALRHHKSKCHGKGAGRPKERIMCPLESCVEILDSRMAMRTHLRQIHSIAIVEINVLMRQASSIKRRSHGNSNSSRSTGNIEV